MLVLLVSRPMQSAQNISVQRNCKACACVCVLVHADERQTLHLFTLAHINRYLARRPWISLTFSIIRRCRHQFSPSAPSPLLLLPFSLEHISTMINRNVFCGCTCGQMVMHCLSINSAAAGW